MKIFVTGGCGFVGSHLVDKLVEEGHDVIVFDNLDSQVHRLSQGYQNPNAYNLAGVRYDVRDRNSLEDALDAERPDVIFHYAAAVGVGQSQYQIKHYIDTNIGGTGNLLQSLIDIKHEPKKIIVAASMSSYGEGAYWCGRCEKRVRGARNDDDLEMQRWDPVCPHCRRLQIEPQAMIETDEYQASSIYAITKAVQEQVVLNYGKTYNVPAIALRLFNIYGPRQSLSNPYTGVAAIFMSRLKNSKPPIVYEDGKQLRTFVSVHDVVQASILAMRADIEGVFNVGAPEQVSVLDVASAIQKMLGTNIEPQITQQYRKGDIRHCYTNTGILGDRGYIPEVSFVDGMKELVEWANSATAEDRFDEMQTEMTNRGLTR